MHAPAGGANALGQAPFESRLTVFIRQLDVPGPTRMLVGQSGEPFTDFLEVGRREQLLRMKHFGVRDGGAHVVTNQALIESVVFAGGVTQYPVVERRSLIP